MSRNYQPIRARGIGRVVYSGCFSTDGSGDPTAQLATGITVTRPGTGLYRLVLDESFYDVASVHAQILKSAVHDLHCQIQTEDEIDSGGKLRAEICTFAGKGGNEAQYLKAATDGAAATTTAETPFFEAPNALTVTAVSYLPGAALTAHDTDYATLQCWRRATDGGTQTAVASRTTQITGGSGNWTAFDAVALTLGAGVALAAGEVLTFQIAKAGNGVAVPLGAMVVTYTDLRAANLVSGAMHVMIIGKDSAAPG